MTLDWQDLTVDDAGDPFLSSDVQSALFVALEVDATLACGTLSSSDVGAIRVLSPSNTGSVDIEAGTWADLASYGSVVVSLSIEALPTVTRLIHPEEGGPALVEVADAN